jgi:hypothetical protein
MASVSSPAFLGSKTALIVQFALLARLSVQVPVLPEPKGPLMAKSFEKFSVSSPVFAITQVLMSLAEPASVSGEPSEAGTMRIKAERRLVKRLQPAIDMRR